MKIKWADFQQSTRSRSLATPIDSAEAVRSASVELVRSVYPPTRGVGLVGVTLSNFSPVQVTRAVELEQLSLT